ERRGTYGVSPAGAVTRITKPASSVVDRAFEVAVPDQYRLGGLPERPPFHPDPSLPTIGVRLGKDRPLGAPQRPDGLPGRPENPPIDPAPEGGAEAHGARLAGGEDLVVRQAWRRQREGPHPPLGQHEGHHLRV